MPTPRQEKLAEAIIENSVSDKPIGKTALLEKVGYAQTTARVKAGEVMEQKGVQEALVAKGFTEENAKRVVSELMLDENQEGNVRLKAADMTFKVHGSYAAEKQIVQQVSVSGTPQDYAEAEALRLKYEEEAKRLLM